MVSRVLKACACIPIARKRAVPFGKIQFAFQLLHNPGFLKFCSHKWKKQRRKQRMDNHKSTPRDSVFLRISIFAPLQNSRPPGQFIAEIITHRCGLIMLRLFNVFSLQQFLYRSFHNYFCGIKHVLTYLLKGKRARTLYLCKKIHQ